MKIRLQPDIGPGGEPTTLYPVFRLKLDELFIRWFTDTITQRNLHNLLKELQCADDPATIPIPSGFLNSYNTDGSVETDFLDGVVGPMVASAYAAFGGAAVWDEANASRLPGLHHSNVSSMTGGAYHHTGVDQGVQRVWGLESGLSGAGVASGSLASPRPSTPPHFPQPPHHHNLHHQQQQQTQHQHSSKLFGLRSPRKIVSALNGLAQAKGVVNVSVRSGQPVTPVVTAAGTVMMISKPKGYN
ncbi:unnamed protein product [Protopolystoma xenopodis]|uniref:Uncharacterized protein n=1 Tax=Protopolystoma xenopodis TaxID=117903 RepID=A0A448WJ35_9PLAT|nr:unnamed protein product [Protopolystoma xenopodis]